MTALFTIVHLTLHEAARRRILTATLIGAAAFLVLYGIGFHFVARHVHEEAGLSVVRQHLMLNFLTLAGLYATHFLAFDLYGLAFIGSWVEQVGALTNNHAAENVGTVASLIMSTEALWQRAAYFMQPTIMRDLHLTPFSPASLPSVAMVWWAVGYA